MRGLKICFFLAFALLFCGEGFAQKKDARLRKRIALCEEVLRRRLTPQQIRFQILREAGFSGAQSAADVPALLTLSSPAAASLHAHEMRTAERYAQWIREHAGETLFFLPTWGYQSVAAFDAIVLNAQLEPVANVSFKFAQGARLKKGVNHALDQMSAFLLRENWFAKFGVWSGRSDYKPGFLWSQNFQSRLDWLDTLMSWFAVERDPRREVRLVIEVAAESEILGDLSAQLAALVERTSELRDAGLDSWHVFWPEGERLQKVSR